MRYLARRGRGAAEIQLPPACEAATVRPQHETLTQNETSTPMTMDLKAHIRAIPDYPKPGILFYDIGTLLAHGPAWRETVLRMADIVQPMNPDVIVGVESRGFLVGAALAAHLGIGFAMVRKKGKLPG